MQNLKLFQKNRILPMFLAFLVFVIFLILVIPDWNSHKNKVSYDVVILGDSILGNVRDETSIPNQLEEELGISVFNGCFGGTCAASTNQEMLPSFVSDNLSLVSLSEAFAFQDFSVVHASVAYGMHYKDTNRQTLPYFEDTVKELVNLDLSQTKILMLSYGTNDYSKVEMLENPENLYDSYSFGGSLRYSIELLQKKYPNLKIILVTPVYCIFLGEEEVDCTEKDFGAGILEDFVDLQLEIAKEYGITVIDNYHNLGIDRQNWEKYLEDGMHPNEDGRELLKEEIVEVLVEELP